MNDFDQYLNKVGEIGFVDEALHSLVYVSGLPKAHPNEVVMFESGDLGQVLSLNSEQVEVILLSHQQVRVGSKVVRTDNLMRIPVDNSVLGRVLDPLGRPIDGKSVISASEYRFIMAHPPKLLTRQEVNRSFETGVSLVDMVVPLSTGQRELVIGDRKTGKTQFLLQTIVSQASKGTICIYAVIGQKHVDIKKLAEYFEQKGIMDKMVIVAASSSDPSGLVYLTPYSAMTIAEYFRDQGKDVMLVLDDMTTHARTYREISLLAKRFPGRSSYPGDIFYIHAQLVERAGNFKKGSITCLPVAESLLGDLSGYIQTNLMAMTDGHIFFDIGLYNEGKRPSVNPFLSVTRVGHQTQTPLERDVSSEMSSFLVNYERMKQFLHFGAEVGETAKNILALGAKLDVFFNQGSETIIAVNINILLVAGLWAGVWSDTKVESLSSQYEQLILAYETDDNFRKSVDDFITSNNTFADMVSKLKRDNSLIAGKLNR